MQNGHCGTGKCKCPCHKMPGILIVLIGVLFLLEAFDVVTPHVVAVGWPILLILFGLKKMCPKGMCKCCDGKGEAK